MKAQSYRLSDVADIIPGISIPGAIQHVPDGDHYLILPRHLSDDGAPFDYAAIHDPVRMNLENIPEERNLMAGDILFMSRGEKNRSIALRSCPPHTVTPSIFYVLRPKMMLINPDFLAWVLNQTSSQSAIASIRTGAVTPLVQRAQLEEISVPVPTLEYQHKITAVTSRMVAEQQIISRIATKTELRNRAISQSLLHHLTLTSST